MFAETERKSLHELITVMEDKELTLLKGADSNIVKRLQEVLGTMSVAEAEDVLGRSSKILSAAVQQDKENADVFLEQD